MVVNRLRKLFDRRPQNISFSKAGDDIQLMKLIKGKTPGAYVDVGCWHPTRWSNTYYFYLRGWRGICVDPNPELRQPFARVRPRDTLITAAVGQASAPMKYYMLEDPHSSMNTLDHGFLREKGLESKIKATVDVPVTPLTSILEQHLGKDDRLDFFDIDVEGFDLDVLRTNDWSRFRPRIVVVESDSPLSEDVHSEMASFMTGVDYRLVGKSVISGDLGNLFFVSK